MKMVLMQINAKNGKDIAVKYTVVSFILFMTNRKDHYETRQANMFPDYNGRCAEAI